jgi:hypothetical protein
MDALVGGVLRSLPRMRRAAESLMTGTFRVERQSGERTAEGYEVATPRVTVYEGRGKLQTYEGHEQALPAGPSTVVQQRMTIHFPVGSFACLPGDLATCTGSTDPLLIGRRFRVTQAYPVKEHATSYRVFVDELIEG